MRRSSRKRRHVWPYIATFIVLCVASAVLLQVVIDSAHSFGVKARKAEQVSLEEQILLLRSQLNDRAVNEQEWLDWSKRLESLEAENRLQTGISTLSDKVDNLNEREHQRELNNINLSYLGGMRGPDGLYHARANR